MEFLLITVVLLIMYFGHRFSNGLLPRNRLILSLLAAISLLIWIWIFLPEVRSQMKILVSAVVLFSQINRIREFKNLNRVAESN